ncbi:VOC family protein [Roseibium denhamense]|uniref:VOC domain-containing protein n=1 Tax=Roseibium denhamense TaxID=76305 RepID=A0ABY1N6Y8_9HYPH|nr:VOC family protein [Roseibium denhamense]MTI06096.1 VOC family protein [Roseibium denhamense]SMP01173.1 hypothetical protein SAMN06265374_0336 [Roseibium denhamense]
MEQRLSMTTLVVDDVTAIRHFFETGLGWQVNAAPSPDIAFYQVPGAVFAVYARAALEKETGITATKAPTGAVTLAWNGRTEDEVDSAYEQALSAGARPIKPPEKVFWGGYSSYVEIPGGHLLEIAFNPYWAVTETGAIILPNPQ